MSPNILTDFNSAFHHLKELPLLEDENSAHNHDLSLTFFGRHKNLVLASRGISSSEVFIVRLSSTIIAKIREISTLAILSGRIPTDDLEDLVTLLSGQFPPTVPRYGWFVRLDAVSTKDSIRSEQSIKTTIDIIYALATSRRALAALDDVESANLYLLPWDPTMTSKREFRVFCPPCNEIKITAISQYAWHSPFTFLEGETPELICEKVLEGSQRILEEIKSSDGYNLMMTRQGFTFDVRLTDSSEVELVELNTFGALTGCGSCLFHWIRDFHELYFGTEILIQMSY